MSEKVKTVASLQSQVSRLEDSSQEVHTQLSNLSVRLREEQQKVQVAQEETQTLRSKIFPHSVMCNLVYDKSPTYITENVQVYFGTNSTFFLQIN